MAAEEQDQRYMTDIHLLRRAREGESQAFDSLFQNHKDGVYACLWHLLDGEPDAVEEAVGAVFLSAWRGLPGFRMESSFSTWLYRIAVNEGRACVRRKRRQRMFGWFSFSEQDSAVVAQYSDPTADALRDEETRELWRAVRALPEPYRTPTILRYMSGLDSREIATVLRRPCGTIRYQLSRAMQLLRERLGGVWLD
jgi:RNA polymerase sigma-70 factor, ECF subfamily